MDRHVGGDGRATGGERLEDQGGVQARKRRSADVLGDVNPAHAQRGGLAHFGDGKMLGLVPGDGMRRKHLGREGARHVAYRDLVFTERELRYDARGWVEHEA